MCTSEVRQRAKIKLSYVKTVYALQGRSACMERVMNSTMASTAELYGFCFQVDQKFSLIHIIGQPSNRLLGMKQPSGKKDTTTGAQQRIYLFHHILKMKRQIILQQKK